MIGLMMMETRHKLMMPECVLEAELGPTLGVSCFIGAVPVPNSEDMYTAP